MVSTLILQKAVNALNDRLHEEQAQVVSDNKSIILQLMGKHFCCVIEPTITIRQFTKQQNASISDMPILYITINASPSLIQAARQSNFNILDCAGNFHIQSRQVNGDIFFLLSNFGEKPVKDILIPNTYSIFKDKGLLLLFFFLLDRQNIGKTFREIQKATGISIGSIKNIIDGMAYHGFVRINGRKRILSNIDRLLSLWCDNFDITLKPKLLLSRMTFRDSEFKCNWRDIQLPDGMLWGGEPASNISNGYLTPQIMNIYTEVPAPILIKTGAVLPDENGEIFIFKKFWQGKAFAQIVPAILIYADLITSGNSRCIETALKMKENELSYLI